MTDAPIKEDDVFYDLNQIDPTLKTLRIAAGWDLREFDGENIDVDLSCFILGKDGKTREDSDLSFITTFRARNWPSNIWAITARALANAMMRRF